MTSTPAITTDGINYSAIPILQRLKQLGIAQQHRKIGNGSASTATYDDLEDGAMVEFKTWAGAQNLLKMDILHNRHLLRSVFERCVDPRNLFSEAEIDTSSTMEAKLASIDWAQGLRARSERYLENTWLPILEWLFKLPIETSYTSKPVKITIGYDRNTLLLPRDLAVYYSKPKPDFITYFGSELDYAIEGTSTLVPLFSVGNKGGPSGSTIDAARPQDMCVTYSIANAYAVWGMPLDDICVLSASTEQGLVTQFFATIFSDPKPFKDYPIRNIDSSNPATPIDSTVEDMTANFQLMTHNDPDHKRPDHKRHLINIPVSRKLDPTDPDDRKKISDLYILMRNEAIKVIEWFLDADRTKIVWTMKAAAEPGEDDS
ncbi:hypothetical protein HDV05_008559, partial [Chytridiales sp. JEL 0842]